MPDPKDFLPPPPWKGPPFPGFFYRGIEYPERPLELEADLGRGVLYLHDPETGITVLRICRLPLEFRELLSARMNPLLDLIEDEPFLGSTPDKLYKKAPVFFDMERGLGSFWVTDEGGILLFEVVNVPSRCLDTLGRHEFTDITVGSISKYSK